MELKLNVYKKEKGKRVVAKTYTTDTGFISFGVIEDLLGELDIDITSDKDIVQAVMKSFNQIKPILKDLFDGITDKEINGINTFDLINVMKQLISYAVTLVRMTGDEKN